MQCIYIYIYIYGFYKVYAVRSSCVIQYVYIYIYIMCYAMCNFFKYFFFCSMNVV